MRLTTKCPLLLSRNVVVTAADSSTDETQHPHRARRQSEQALGIANVVQTSQHVTEVAREHQHPFSPFSCSERLSKKGMNVDEYSGEESPEKSDEAAVNQYLQLHRGNHTVLRQVLKVVMDTVEHVEGNANDE